MANTFDTLKNDALGEKPVVTSNDKSNKFTELKDVALNIKSENIGYESSTISSGQFGSSKYDSGINPSTFESIEERRAQKQDISDKWANGIVKAAGIAGTSILENTVGLVYGLGSAITNTDASKIYHNDFTEPLVEFNDYLTKAMPNYHTKAEQDYNLLQKFGTANFWSDQALNGLGFMVGAVVTGMGLGKFASLAKLARTGAFVDEAKLAVDGAEYLDKVARTVKIANKVDFAKNAVLMSTGESSLEADGIYKDTKNNLIADYKTKFGTNPDEVAMKQIESDAKAAGNFGYAANLAITGTVNALFFSKLLSKGFGDNKRLLNDIAFKEGKYVSEVVNPTKGLLKKTGEGVLEEGGQESSQLMIQKTLTDYYSQGFKDKKDQHDMVESISSGLQSTLGTEEGLENFFLGALLGGPGAAIHNRGAITEQNNRSQQMATIMNSDTFKKTINTFDNFVRSSNYEKQKDEALKTGSKFDYLTAEFNQNKSIVKQFLDNGGKEVLIQQYKDMQGMSEEDFKTVTGYEKDKPLPHPQSEIINNAVKFVEDLDKTNSSIKELFPFDSKIYGTTENYSILTENLLHYSTSIENMDKRARDIKNDMFKIATDKAVNIVGDGITTPFTIDGNPMVAEQFKQMNNDLDLIKQYKDKLIESYNKLSNQETQKQTLDKIIKTATKEATKQEDIQNVDELTNKNKESQNAQNEVKTPINNIISNTDITKNVVKPEIVTDLESEHHIDESVESIHGDPLIDEDGRKPDTINKTNGGNDGRHLDAGKISENIYFDKTENMPIDGHRLLIVTKQSNPDLYHKILLQDPTALNYERVNPKYKGVWTILVDKNNQPVMVDGKGVISTLETASRIDKGEIRVGDKEEAKNTINKTREDALKLKKGQSSYLRIIGKSKGLSVETDENGNLIHSAFELRKEGVRQNLPTLGRIFKTLEELKNAKLELATQKNSLINGVEVLPGKLYVTDSQGRVFDLIPRTLIPSEINDILNLINQELSGEKQVESPIDEIKKIISFKELKKSPEFQIYIDTKGIIPKLVFGDRELVKEEFEHPELQQEVRKFLENKRVNVNKDYLQGAFREPSINGEGKRVNYNEYLLSGESPMFGTDLKSIKDDKGADRVRFIQSYFIYNPTLEGEVKLEDPKPLQEEKIIADNITPVIKNIDEELVKPVIKRKPGSERLLARLESVAKDKSKLTQEERNWFSDRFPNIPIESIIGLIEGKSLGQFLSSAKVLLSDEAYTGTLYHEAFHAITQLYLTPKEIDSLYKEASLKYPNKTRKQLEEILAEDFTTYKKNGEVLGSRPQRNTIFRKILNFIKNIIGITNVQQVYERLDKGYYTNSKLINTKEFSSLNRDVDTKRITTEKGTKFVKDILDGLDVMFFDYIYEGGRTPIAITANFSNIIGWLKEDFKYTTETFINKNLADEYKYILDNWNPIVKMWGKRLQSEGIDLKIVNADIADENGEFKDDKLDQHSSKGDYSEGNLTATLETISSPVRMLLRSLKQVNTTNDLGLPVPVDFNSTYKYLLKNTVGTGSSYIDLYNKINSLVKFKPEFRELLDRLGEPSIDLDFEHQIFQNQFLVDFNKNRTESYITVYSPDGNVISINATKQGESERVQTEWEGNIRLFTNQDKDGKLTLNLNIVNEKLNNVDFLSKIGINFSKSTLDVIKDPNFDNRSLNASVIAIKNYITEKNGNVTNLYLSPKGLSEEDTKSSVKSRLNYLINLEAEHSIVTNELSYISAEGKTEYSVGENNGLSITSNFINNAKTLDELRKTCPQLFTISSEGSLWLDELFDENGNKIPNIKVNLELQNGLNTSKEAKDDGVDEQYPTRKSTIGDLYSQQVINLLNGKSSYLVSADKSQEYLVSISGYENKTKTPIKIESLKDGFNSIKLKSIMSKYFKTELKRIALFELDGLGKNVDTYNLNGGKFAIFQEILGPVLTKVIQDKVNEFKVNKKSYNDAQNDLNDYTNTIQPQIDTKVVEFFDKYFKEVKNQLEDNGLTKDLGIPHEFTDKYSLDQIIRSITTTDFINSVEQTKFFTGDLVYYKDLFKRTAMNAGSKTVPRVDNAIDSWLNSKAPRKDGKIANGKENTIVFNDIKTTKQDLRDVINKYIEAKFTEQEAYNLLGFSLDKETGKIKGKKAYGEYEETDAMGYSSMDFRREFEIRSGTWTKLKENAYQTIQKQIFDKEGNLIPSETSKLLSKDEIALFTTLKLQYSGPVEGVDKNSTEGLFVPGGYKFTVMPLIPQMIAGKNLSKVLERMAENESGISLFKTASKFGTIVNEKGDANKFYTQNNHGEISNDDLIVQSISYKYLGLQVKPSEPHPEYIFSTQFRKTIFIDAFSNGEETFKGAKSLLDEFNKLIDSKTIKAKNQLIKELGINPENYKSEDVTKLVELLTKASEERSLPDNIIDSLDIEVINGKTLLKYNIDSMVNKPKIDSMLMALVNSRLIKQKVNGDAYVLASVAGMEKLGNRTIGTNPALRGYTIDLKTNKTLPAEVMIPMSDNYKPLLNKYGSLKALNNAIANGEIDPRVLELVGCRIPGQGMNSNEYLTIKEFLPEDSGTTMIAHPEIVAKAGSDFDNDKLYTYRPTLNEQGEYIDSHVDNKVINVIKALISHENNFLALITPNSTNIIDPIVDQLKYNEYVNGKTLKNNQNLSEGRKEESIMTKNKYLEYIKNNSKSNIKYTSLLQLHKKVQARHKLWLAKDEVGMSAIANAYGPLAQIGGITANKTYKTDRLDKEGKEIIKDVKINLPHNELNDKLDLSATKDALGVNKISEINNQLINIIVDAAKDEVPMVAYLNMTMDTLPVYMYLNRLGVPFELVANLMTQPIINDYITKIGVNKSMFLKASNKSLKSYELVNQIKSKYSKSTNEEDKSNYQTKIFTLDELQKYQQEVNQNSKDFDLFQLQVLNDFLEYKEQAGLFGDAVRITNNDSAGLGQNVNSSKLKLKDYEDVKKANFINGINDIIDKTFIKSFQQDQFAIDAYSQFYDTQKPIISKTILGLANDIEETNGKTLSRDNKLKLVNDIENDFINFVVQNFNPDYNSDINKVKNELFKGDNSVAKQLLTLKNKTKEQLIGNESELQKNKFIQELFPLLDKAEKGWNNVKIFTKRLDTFNSNQLTESFRDIKRLDPVLFDKIVNLGLLQSGLSNSPITYTGLIPFEYYNEVVKNSFKEFNTKDNFDNIKIKKENKISKDQGISDLKSFFLKNDNKDNKELIDMYDQPKLLSEFEQLYIANDNKIIGYGMYGKDYSLKSLNKVVHSLEDNNKSNTKLLKDKFKLNKKEFSFDKTLDIKRLVNLYNKTNNTKHFVNFNRIGQSNTYTWNLIENWNNFNPNQTTITYNNQSIETKQSLVDSKVEEYIKDKDYVTSGEISDLIKENGSEQEKELIKILEPHLDGITSVEFVDQPKNNGEGSFGYTKEIKDNSSIEIKNSRQDKTRIYLHEATHEATVRQIDQYYEDKSKLNSNQIEAIESLIDLHEFTKNDSNLGEYGLHNVQEFVAEILSNKEFQDKTNNIEYKKESVFSKFINNLLNLFGIKKDSVLAHSFKNIIKLLDNSGNNVNLGKTGENITNSLNSKETLEGADSTQGEGTDKKPNTEIPKEIVNESAYKKQYILFKRRIKALENQKSKYKRGTDKYIKLQAEIDKINTSLADSIIGNEHEIFLTLGRETLSKVQGYIEDLENKTGSEDSSKNIKYSLETIEAFREFDDLAGEAIKLRNRLFPFTQELGRKNINDVKTEKFDITQEMINAQNNDISVFKEGVASLRNLENYIARTAGILVGNAQNESSTKRKHLKDEIQSQLDELSSYAKKNGEKMDSIWNTLTQEHEGTLVLTKPTLSDGSVNQDFKKIQDTPELKKFYDYYQSNIIKYQQGLPFKPGQYFIPNLHKSSFKGTLSGLVKVKSSKEGGFVGTEGLYADILSTKFMNNINVKDKSNNLADALLEFGHHSNSYNALNEVLPDIRVLQEMIKSKINSKGDVVDREFIKDSDPSKQVIGENSNINSMINKWVDMQIKGEMKTPNWKIKVGQSVDENGDINGEKYIHGTELVDLAIKTNSLVKIGFAPVSILSNISFGQISNIIESVGGKFFNIRQLHLANKLFWKQTFVKDSMLNKLLEEFNLLKEQDDYEKTTNAEFKDKISIEKFEELAFSGQKAGEKWNQSTTVLSVMIKDGYIKDEKLTDKWNNATEKEKTDLVNKTQRINAMTHGRYSQQEAATASQKVWFRAVSQFRKWFFAMYESRFNKAQYDVDLVTDIEGRYRTFSRLMFSKSILDNISKMTKGELTETEMYNMKKNLTEVILFAATTLFALALTGSGDDDKKRKKNPFIKLTLTLLQRAAGDLDFFYSPKQIVNLSANAIPVAKFAGDLLKTIEYIPYAFDYDNPKSKFRSGLNKGKNKELVQVLKDIPALNAVLSAENVLNDNTPTLQN